MENFGKCVVKFKIFSIENFIVGCFVFNLEIVNYDGMGFNLYFEIVCSSILVVNVLIFKKKI